MTSDARDTDYAYLAGMVDGEGTITIYKHQQHKRPTFQLKPRLIVSNSHRGVLDEIETLHGGYTRLHKREQGVMVAIYQWRVFAASEILFLINSLIPYLRIKKDRAVLVSEFIQSRLLVKHASKYNRGYTDREMEIYAHIGRLNVRGVQSQSKSALHSAICTNPIDS